MRELVAKVGKLKYINFRYRLEEPVTQVTRFSMALEPSLDFVLLSSALAHLRVRTLTDSTDNFSEMCPLQLTDFWPVLCYQSYTISLVVITGA